MKLPRPRKPKLIPEWKRAWKYYSTIAMAAATALQGSWLAVPEDLRSGVGGKWVSAVSMAILVLGIIGRLLDQGGKK